MAEAHQHHAVQFYDNDAALFTTVADFLGQALLDQQPAVLIATAAHREPILDSLEERMIDVVAAERRGDFVVLDAQETLARFMACDGPSPQAFETHVGRLIADIHAKRSEHTLTRAYGEMVDVLCRQGKADAAIELEVLWNQLAARYGFALLCAYSIGHFYREANKFEDVCRQHAHVVPPRAHRQPSRSSIRL